MNRIETVEWLSHHGNSFPDFGSWLANIQPADKRSKLIDAWAEAFEDVELRDAKAVTRRMVAGDDPPIAAYEREQTPAKVRTLAKANRDRRAERDRQTTSKQRHDTPAARNMTPVAGKLFRDMLKLMDANPSLTAREAAEQIMPPTTNDGPRFNCRLCLDSGIVIVWSSVSVRAALYGELDQKDKRRTCGAPCKCQEGAKKIWSGSGDAPQSWRGWRDANAMYDPSVHCIAHGGDTDSPDAIAKFKEWVILANEAYKNRNRVAAFDDFNNQAAREF